MDAELKKAMDGYDEPVKNLYEKYKNQVYLLCTTLIEDKQEVDYVFIDIFKEIWKVAPQKNLNTMEDFEKLLMRTAIKYCQNKVFSGNPHIFRDNKPKEFQEIKIEEKESTITYNQVTENCKKLSAPCRFIFISCLLTKLNYHEIGQAINVEEIVVESYYQQALYELKDNKVEEYKSALHSDFIIPQTTNTTCLDYIDEVTKPEKSKLRIILPILLILALIGGAIGYYVYDSNRTYMADIVVEDYGTITVELDSEDAPKTVKNFVNLAQDGFYDGLTFHRIIDGFMIQGGDPNGDGTGGSDANVEGEFSENGHENNLSHVRGTISMARSSDYDSASSQFFIVQTDSTYLDGQYAAFGTVTSGMDIVDKICEDATPYDDNGSIYAEEQPVIETIKIYKK